MKKIYLISDDNIKDFDTHVSKVENALKGGVELFQYRSKNTSSRVLLEEAKIFKSLCEKYNTKFIINDRIDIALAVDADGVHLGGDDLPVSVARSILGPNKIIGATAKTIESAQTAENEGANYLGSGALYTSPTKSDARRISVENLKAITESVSIPVYGIGGISLTNLTEEIIAIVDGVAVVSALLSHDCPTTATATLHNILGNNK